jgi:hypothetical protein
MSYTQVFPATAEATLLEKEPLLLAKYSKNRATK